MYSISEPGADQPAYGADQPAYGVGETSFLSAGGIDGIRVLVDHFYDAMEDLPVAARIRKMHPDDLAVSRDKLARFLCGWLGGPKLYSEKYGSIRIPHAHAHMAIGSEERDAWLACMEHALTLMDYRDDFKTYLMAQLFVPAERCRTRD